MRTLGAVREAAYNLSLNPMSCVNGDLVIVCPICRDGGLYARAAFRFEFGVLGIRCGGCERYGDDPHDILYALGHNPEEGEPFELVLRVFDLLWALHRTAVAA